MRKNKYNPELLKEELNRVQMLMEFDFPDLKEDYDDKPVILNNIDEEDDMSAETDAIAKDLGVDPNASGAPAPPPTNDPNSAPPAPTSDPNAAPAAPATPEDPNAAPAGDLDFGSETSPEAPATDAGGESEEIDVTSLVNGTEDAKRAAEDANKTSEMLLQKLADLEAKLSRMDAVGAKIETLEKEIIKRNPTPVEKLELRSLDSAPFNQKLGDYWADKEGAYDVMNQKKEEYVLTKDDIDGNYSDVDIKKSFGANDNEYEEEDI